jgi:hypothetical protein
MRQQVILWLAAGLLLAVLSKWSDGALAIISGGGAVLAFLIAGVFVLVAAIPKRRDRRR